MAQLVHVGPDVPEELLMRGAQQHGLLQMVEKLSTWIM